jgi:hypothetical protein
MIKLKKCTTHIPDVLQADLWAVNILANVAEEVAGGIGALLELIGGVDRGNMLLKGRAVRPRLKRAVVGGLNSLNYR